MTDGDLACKLAEDAGRMLVRLREDSRLTGKKLGKAGDETANEMLVAALREARPDDGLLSEESKDTKDRLTQDRVWIIDPVDGTREYGEARSDWAVHVALAVRGQAVTGAVSLPDLGVTLRSDRPGTEPIRQDRLRMVVSRSRPAKEALHVAKKLDAELIPMGSAGAKSMAVVRGEADIYLHSGGQYEWDNCAPVAVAQAHGLHCSRIDGAPLIYNQSETWLPDLLICHKEDAAQILAIVAAL
ncbi:3'(2'),5'-bisphosphate nucleotidase CysQ [Parasphingorhabdus sp.]